MALGRQRAVQGELLIGWHEVPTAPGHVFYDRLNAVLDGAGFDRQVESLCAPHDAAKTGRPSVPPGRYFRMLFVGYFEGLDGERGIAWRCADSLSLRHFLQLGASEAVPDHSTLSRTRARQPLEVHDAVFALVLELVVGHGLVKGRRVGVDASTMEANAAMRSIVRREDGAGWQAMLGELARRAGSTRPPRTSCARSTAAAPAIGSRTRMGEPHRPGGQDHPDEGRPHSARLQARARGRSGHRRDPGSAGSSWRRRRHADPRGDARGGGGQSRHSRPRAGARRSR